MINSSISKRGIKAANTVLRSDFELFFEAKNDLYNPDTNPNGKFPLNMAENNLSWQPLKQRIEEVLRNNTIPNWVPSYTGIGGSDEFLRAIANFMTVHLTECEIKTDSILTSSGATGVLELASWVLCDKGDVTVIPAPAYPVYTQDIGNKSGVERFDVVTHYDLENGMNDLILSVSHLQKAKIQIEASGRNFKLLILTTPDNPTGKIYSADQLNEITDWCIQHNIHLLVNELYGLSIINTKHQKIKDDYKREIDFTSFAQIMSQRQSDYLHLCYGLSKDLGISGFRIGIIHSLNESFLKAYANLNAPHMVSNLTQWVMSIVLSDVSFMTKYINDNQQRLTENYIIVAKCLRELNIPYVPASGSLFVWLELSEFLRENNQQHEDALWEELYERSGILLTPGLGFGHSKKGQFRLVYSFVNYQLLSAAMDKFAIFIKMKRSNLI